MKSDMTFIELFQNRHQFFRLSENEIEQKINKAQNEINQLRELRKELQFTLKIIKKLSELFDTPNQRELALRVLDHYPELNTPKQVQVVVWSLLGKDTKDIAREQCVSIQAVKFIKTVILRKTKHKTMNALIAEIVQSEVTKKESSK